MKGLFTKIKKSTQPNRPGMPDVQRDGCECMKEVSNEAVSPSAFRSFPAQTSLQQHQVSCSNTTKRMHHTGPVNLNHNLPGPGKVYVQQVCPGDLPSFFVEEVLLSGLQGS